MIVRPNPGGRDLYGDRLDNYDGEPIRIDLPGAAWAPKNAVATNDRGRDGSISSGTLYAAPDTDLRSSDQVEIDGDLYDVDGDPANWIHPSGYGRGGLSVDLHRAAG